jgi:two-component system NtrC family sensor kinase
MTIRRKLPLTIGFILALVAVLDITFFHSLGTIRKRLTLVESMDDLGASISEMRRGEKNYLLYHDENSAQDWVTQVLLTRQAIREKAAELTALEGAEYYRQLVNDFSIYESLARRLVSSVGDDLDPDQVRDQGQIVHAYSRGVIDAERERIDATIRSSYRVFFVSLFVIAISGLAGAWIIVHDIVRPLAKIERATHRVSAGSYVPVEGIRSNDEIGELQRAFNDMVQQIEKHQDELVQAGKLTSLGTLTSGVAHELNNPINNISMIAQTFVQYHDSISEEERLDLMSRIDGQCERAREIIVGLLDFSRVHPRTFSSSDVGQVMQESLRLVENQLTVSKIVCELEIAENLPSVHLSPNRIKQVLINLFTNAIKAMPEGGKLTVEAMASEDARFVDIAITDTGVGIPPTALPHIFDPFFTTSEAGQGAGLGLSVSYGIVKRHGGSIAVRSKIGEGSTFTVRLPVKEEQGSDGNQA